MAAKSFDSEVVNAFRTALREERLEAGEVSMLFSPPPHDFYKPHDSFSVSDFPPSLTRQEFAEDCDINVIMARFENGETITHVARSEPLYLDYTSMPTDLQSAMEFMRGAAQEFMRLPAHVRREFDNDPVKFVAFAENPENLDRMRAWDLAPKPSEPAGAPPAGSELPASPAAPAAPGAPQAQ